MKKIRIDVKTDGNIDIEALGFEGIGCKEATKVFEDALGEVTSREVKPEMYSKEKENIHEKTRR